MCPISIRTLSFKAPRIDSDATAIHFRTLTAKIEQYVRKLGKKSGLFSKRREALFRAAKTGENIADAMESTAFIRPLLDLWNNEPEFVKQSPPNLNLMSRLENLLNDTKQKRLGRLALREACQLFFQHYTSAPGFIGPYHQFLIRQLRLFRADELMIGLDHIHRNADKIIQPEGHLWFVRQSDSTHCPLPDLANQFGVITPHSTFYQACQAVFYIARIEALSPNEDNDILNDVRLKKIHETPFKEGILLGHAIISSLIDKLAVSREHPSDKWLQTILSIAGDPRIPPGHHRYVKWWSQLGQRRMTQMRRWLSRFDMNLFLEIVEAFSETGGGDDMERMFPQRKRFLEGLFSSGRVDEAQLFLHNAPAGYLKDSLRGNESLPYFRRLTGQNPNLAIFYFRMGDVHLIEGTHNFALTIVDAIPDACPAGRFDTDFVDSRTLGVGLEEAHTKQFGDSGRCVRITHHRTTWVKRAYEALKSFKIIIDPNTIMDKEDYRRLYQ